MAKDKPTTKLSYEQALEELEKALESLEKGDRNLEETMALFERGKNLLNRCRDLLKQAELRVTELNTGDDKTKDLEDDS